MNIDDYLEDITNMVIVIHFLFFKDYIWVQYYSDISQCWDFQTGIPPEEIELDDYELQKCNILYNDDKIRTFESYDPFAHDVGLHEQLVPADYGEFT